MSVFSLVFVLMLSVSMPAGPAATSVALKPLYTELTPDQTHYFFSLYQDTWNYLSTFVDKFTGIPYDSSAHQPATSISNIGYYLASVAIAYQTGLVSHDEALDRTQKALASLDQIKKWRGFPRPWIIARTLKTTHGPEFSYAPHLSVLIGGLIVSKNTFPEVADSIDKMFLEMQFRDLYDPQNGWLKGGYNAAKKNFAIYQPWGHWYYKYFASDSRLLSFYALARDLIPKEHWFLLLRPVQEKEGEKFYAAGYEESGMSVPFTAGLFLDERNTEMGDSQRAYARSQMKHAKNIGAPVWGWAFCESPKGQYLANGEMRDSIVAPYASILASIYFPAEAYENLKVLESLGARPQVQGKNFGFRDSIDWESKAVAEDSLTPSNAMSFLSIANLLFDGIVWKTFQKDPIVARGLETLDLAKAQAPFPVYSQKTVTMDVT